MLQSIQVPTGSRRCSRPLRARPTIREPARVRKGLIHKLARCMARFVRVVHTVPTPVAPDAPNTAVTAAAHDASSCRRRRRRVRAGRWAPRRGKRCSRPPAAWPCPPVWQPNAARRCPSSPDGTRTDHPAPGATKRPKEPRVRSLHRLCKHLQRRFRSRGPFRQNQRYVRRDPAGYPGYPRLSKFEGRFRARCPPTSHVVWSPRVRNPARAARSDRREATAGRRNRGRSRPPTARTRAARGRGRG
jgi:hypothetical protein